MFFCNVMLCYKIMFFYVTLNVYKIMFQCYKSYDYKTCFNVIKVMLMFINIDSNLNVMFLCFNVIKFIATLNLMLS